MTDHDSIPFPDVDSRREQEIQIFKTISFPSVLGFPFQSQSHLSPLGSMSRVVYFNEEGRKG